MKKFLPILLTCCLVVSSVSLAQEAPTPHKSPRTPVNRQALPDHKPAVPPSSTIQGQATIIDTEKLRVADVDLRLFGVVPPQLSASFGPQARAALDTLVSGQMFSCLIRDRDQAGRYLATCHTPNNTDLAVELLRRGLAVTARGSLASTDLLGSYIAAEQAAQSQKIGLWSVVTPAAASVAATPKSEASVVLPTPLPAVADVKPVKIEKTENVASKNVPADTQVKVASAVIPASELLPDVDDTLPAPPLSPSECRHFVSGAKASEIRFFISLSQFGLDAFAIQLLQ